MSALSGSKPISLNFLTTTSNENIFESSHSVGQRIKSDIPSFDSEHPHSMRFDIILDNPYDGTIKFGDDLSTNNFLLKQFYSTGEYYGFRKLIFSEPVSGHITLWLG